MRKAFAACIAASALSLNVMAEQAFMAPLVKESVLLDVDASEYVVIVGERGHILISPDGESFEQVQVPTQSTLTA